MRTEGQCRCDAIYGMMYVGTKTMGRLFRVMWQQANDEEYTENGERDMLSQSTVDLHEKIRHRGSSFPLMEDWNVQKMCDALDVMLPKGKTVFCANMRRFGHCRFGGGAITHTRTRSWRIRRKRGCTRRCCAMCLCVRGSSAPLRMARRSCALLCRRWRVCPRRASTVLWRTSS